MKSLTSVAIVALTAGIIGFGGAVPAIAQQQAPQGQQMQPQMQQPGFGMQQGHNMRPQMRMRAERGMRGGGLIDLVCSERGAERLEIALVRLSHRIDPTAEQAPLFEDLKSTALTAQTQFADSCADARPTASAEAPADPVAAMRTRIEVEKARLAALETVLPKFEALYASLTDAQKAELAPQRGKARFGDHRRGNPGEMPGMPGGPGMMQQGQPGAGQS